MHCSNCLVDRFLVFGINTSRVGSVDLVGIYGKHHPAALDTVGYCASACHEPLHIDSRKNYTSGEARRFSIFYLMIVVLKLQWLSVHVFVVATVETEEPDSPDFGSWTLEDVAVEEVIVDERLSSILVPERVEVEGLVVSALVPDAEHPVALVNETELEYDLVLLRCFVVLVKAVIEVDGVVVDTPEVVVEAEPPTLAPLLVLLVVVESARSRCRGINGMFKEKSRLKII